MGSGGLLLKRTGSLSRGRPSLLKFQKVVAEIVLLTETVAGIVLSELGLISIVLISKSELVTVGGDFRRRGAGKEVLDRQGRALSCSRFVDGDHLSRPLFVDDGIL